MVTVLGILASALLLVPATPSAAAEPVEDMGCHMVVWTSDSVFDTSYDHSGMRHTFRGCMVKRGWSSKAYRALKNRQWRRVCAPSTERDRQIGLDIRGR